MLLFSRQLTLMGSPRQTMPWAMEITAYVNDHTPLEVSLWASSFGNPVGTVGWTTLLESQEQLADATASLGADSGYLDLVEKAADMITAPAQDQLGEIVHGSPTGRAPVGAVAQLTVASAIVDQMAPALGFAVEIAEHVGGVVGAPVMVLTSMFGTMGGIAWIGVQPDMASADAARAKMLADSSYLDLLTKSKGLFIPGSGYVSQSVRVV
jgi:hypothetical protein